MIFFNCKKFCLLLLTLVSAELSAINLQIKNPEFINDKVYVDISWENSWNYNDTKPPYNYDAVWVFMKYKNSDGIWGHLCISSDSTLHYLSYNSMKISTVDDEMGVFVKRRSGEGTNNFRLGLSFCSTFAQDIYELQVFGIEMVYIPEEAFYVGDGESNNHLHKWPAGGPYYVDSELPIELGEVNNSMQTTGNDLLSGQIGENYPKGFNAFYAMKYEINQWQYTDFLNTLTFEQQLSRVSNNPESPKSSSAYVPDNSFHFRNNIVIKQSGDENLSKPAVYEVRNNSFPFYDGKHRSANFLSWYDVLAYLDWSGLRPMTELEFEKICRGPKVPVPLEFAWGTPFHISAIDPILDATIYEHVSQTGTITAGILSHGYDSPQGPLRNGFSSFLAQNRVQAAASYYGVMEMSGNVWEVAVGLRSDALQFIGSHGNGILSNTGNTTQSDWPVEKGGYIYRGGGWNSGVLPGFRDASVSDRFYDNWNLSGRRNTSGGRGVRSAH
ncbi:MAG: hypothetical protein EA412_08995 [Chitinophagaceae bacterium]|nr:MAG: hypothetical protein EA412_08995 [Chitinophagaceae bacterium]